MFEHHFGLRENPFGAASFSANTPSLSMTVSHSRASLGVYCGRTQPLSISHR